ncbi:unnamed protein product, partial [marine sediment metagenome]
DKGEDDVKTALVDVQREFRLARIYLLNTGLEGYWHAYCFQAHSWADTLRILASTPGIDRVFFKIGAIREYFTLRFTPKKRRDFKPAVILPSKIPEDVDPYKLNSFVTYWTKRM